MAQKDESYHFLTVDPELTIDASPNAIARSGCLHGKWNSFIVNESSLICEVIKKITCFLLQFTATGTNAPASSGESIVLRWKDPSVDGRRKSG